MIKLFEKYNKKQYIIISNLNGTDDIMVNVSLYYNKVGSTEFKYIDEYDMNTYDLSYYTFEDAKKKVKSYKRQHSDYNFKYISIDDFNQMIKDIETKKDANKYNL